MKIGDVYIAVFITLAMAGASAGIFYASPQRAMTFSSETPPTSGMVAFDAFGPSHTFGTNSWGVGGKAHADWFVPSRSGHLSAIELAIEPQDRNSVDAIVTLASDHNGFPGAIIESFLVTPQMVTAATNTAPVVLNSVQQPVLEAGKKYWLGVRGRGAWIWHFNNQNIAQNAAREVRREQWASAGDYCYICAFRILITADQDPKPSGGLK